MTPSSDAIVDYELTATVEHDRLQCGCEYVCIETDVGKAVVWTLLCDSPDCTSHEGIDATFGRLEPAHSIAVNHGVPF